MKTWIKLYTELLDDPDVGLWPLEHIGFWALILVLAGKIDDRDEEGKETGRLDTLDRVSWHLRKAPGFILPLISAFQDRGMLHVEEEIFFVTNYPKRQARPPSARRDAVRQRVKRWRNDKAKERNEVTPSLQPNGNDGVTQLDTDKKRIDTEAEAEVDPATAAVFDAWFRARGGAMNQMDSEQLGAYIDECTAEWVLEAIKVANESRQDKLPSLRYVRSILDRWQQQGFKAPFDAKKRRHEMKQMDDAKRTKQKVRDWEKAHGIT
jgi:DnaD/phage-associated family protein